MKVDLDITWGKVLGAIIFIGLIVAAVAGWWSSFQSDLEAARIARENEKLLEQREFMRAEKTDWETAFQRLTEQDQQNKERYSEGLRELAEEFNSLREDLGGDADASSAIVGGGSVEGTLEVPGQSKRDVQVDSTTGVGEIRNNDGNAFVKGITNVKVFDKETGKKILDEDVPWDDNVTDVFDFDVNHEHKKKYAITIGFGLDTNGRKNYLLGGSYRFPEIKSRFNVFQKIIPDSVGVVGIYSEDDSAIIGTLSWEF